MKEVRGEAEQGRFLKNRVLAVLPERVGDNGLIYYQTLPGSLFMGNLVIIFKEICCIIMENCLPYVLNFAKLENETRIIKGNGGFLCIRSKI